MSNIEKLFEDLCEFEACHARTTINSATAEKLFELMYGIRKKMEELDSLKNAASEVKQNVSELMNDVEDSIDTETTSLERSGESLTQFKNSHEKQIEALNRDLIAKNDEINIRKGKIQANEVKLKRTQEFTVILKRMYELLTKTRLEYAKNGEYRGLAISNGKIRPFDINMKEHKEEYMSDLLWNTIIE
ncbi:DgyrCDS1280 [Dimorphilus gyrociliatus]|uniref:DgyrCDS1280 n=1 Tax=Dimorphilus gyrociliatus TaxID=2664684 RepID=A0A7I8V9Y6_9ANNE|nr:DgyrCDS1280 [Dimorphilus gyrociliatus]